MILSASRRTDIPNFYGEWFAQRVKEGYVCVANPMNAHQVSKVPLSPRTVDCIVFWSKNPEPFFPYLPALEEYPYYFQFTLTGYGRDIEPGLPDKRERLLPTFRRLSELLGADRVVWRYDPIFLTPRYTFSYHLHAFGKIAEALEGYTCRAVISFLDLYAGIKKRMEALGTEEMTEDAMQVMAGRMAETAKSHGIEVVSCAEAIDLSSCGVSHGSCIDKQMVEQLTGCPIRVEKDRNQRRECGCVQSTDIGAYDTCGNGCAYCYAGGGKGKRADASSPILCRELTSLDVVTEKEWRSVKDMQMDIFHQDLWG